MILKEILNNKDAIIIVSDVHLTLTDTEKLKIFLNLLDIILQSQIKYLVFLGDIFDFALGSSIIFQNQYKTLLEVINKLSDFNIKVIFLEGNHEFNIKALYQFGLHYTGSYIYKIKTSANLSLLFTHGDEIFSDIKYKIFKLIVKSNFMICIAKIVPYCFLENFAFKQANWSRKVQSKKKKNHAKIIFNAFNFLTKHSSDILFFGHFHEKYCIKNSNNKIIIGVESWEHIPNCTIIVNNKFFRSYYNYDSNNWTVVEDTPVNI